MNKMFLEAYDGFVADYNIHIRVKHDEWHCSVSISGYHKPFESTAPCDGYEEGEKAANEFVKSVLKNYVLEPLNILTL